MQLGGSPMCKTNWLTHASKAVLVAAALLMSGGPNTAHASTLLQPLTRFAVGWNLVRIAACQAGQANGVDWLYIASSTSDALVTTDPITVGAAAQFCANGNAFYVFSPDGVTLTNILLVPGLK